MSFVNDSTGLRWDARSAYAELSRAQKPAFGTPAYSRFVNRPAGRWLAAAACAAGLSPNQVSALSALCSFGAIAALLAFPGSPALAVVVTGLLVLGYALDSADGQVARLLRIRSRFGEWLDHMIDCAKTSTLHLAVLVHLYRFTDLDVRWLLVPMVYLVAANILFFGMILVDQLRRSVGDTSTKTGGSLSVARSLAILPSDYGALCLVFLSLAWTPLFLGLYSVFALGAVLLLGAALAKWVRELRAADNRVAA
jgi:phosphatidylglycerophosphate synthase